MEPSQTEAAPYVFPEPLREGVILARPNRFIMDVLLDGDTVNCHCPAVTRIGNLDLAERPCLVSESSGKARKTPFTVEAFSLEQPDAATTRWIGINQTASNRYVEHFLKQGAFRAMIGPVETINREVRLGGSRLDFLINDDLYLEAKTPLGQIQTDVPDYVPRLPDKPFSSTERAMRHLRELAASLADHGRAIVLYCFYYDNPGFCFYHGATYDEVMHTVQTCRDAGVELWQANFELTQAHISLQRYYRLERW